MLTICDQIRINIVISIWLQAFSFCSHTSDCPSKRYCFLVFIEKNITYRSVLSFTCQIFTHLPRSLILVFISFLLGQKETMNITKYVHIIETLSFVLLFFLPSWENLSLVNLHHLERYLASTIRLYSIVLQSLIIEYKWEVQLPKFW